MLKKVKNCLRRLASSERMKMLAFMLLVGTTVTFAQSAAGDYSQGTTALETAVKVRNHWKEAEKPIPIEAEGLSPNSLFQSEALSVCTDITGNSIPA